MSPTENEVREAVQRVLNRLLAAPDATGTPGQGARPGGAATPQSQGRPLIDETVVRGLAPGSKLHVPPDALVTPLAREAARERNITLIEGDPALPAALAQSNSPAAQRVALGADHAGFSLKEALKPYLQSLGYEPIDCGTHSADSVDYPDIAYAVARLVADGQCANGIMIDGVGIGSCMAANKVPGVRAALCYDHATATNSREHNHANVLTLGAGLIGLNLAKQIVQTWLATPYGPGRHAKRVDKIMAIEKRFLR